MTPEVFTQLREEAHKALHRHHLRDALYLINMLLREGQLSDALDDCQQLEDSYGRMLQFIRSGGTDEDSGRMRARMMEKALQLLILAERQYRLQNEESHYVQTRKQIEEHQECLRDVAGRYVAAGQSTQSREALLDQLFYHIWTSAPLGSHEEIMIQGVLEHSTDTEQCVLMSALGMALVEYMDAAKVDLLIQYAGSTLMSVKVRAIMGITLCALCHEKDMLLCGELTERISTLTQDSEIQKITARLNQAFLICLQTQTAREKMEKDILPGFMKMAKDGRIDLGFDQDGEIQIDMPLDNAGDRKALKNSVMEFIDMHKDGIDLNAGNMMATRSLPFFRQLPHWFLPFDKQRTEIREIAGEQENASLIGNMMDLMGMADCDTDRYGTLLLMFRHLGKEIKEQLSSLLHLRKDSEASDEGGIFHQIEKLGSLSHNDDRLLCRKYMQQLYRVFNMFHHCQEWQNPFTFSTNWLQNGIIGPALSSNRKSLHMLADFLVKYKNYTEAEAYLNHLVRLEGSDAETLRTAAYCKQQQGHFGSALTLYSQADILAPEHSWTLAQMQLCYGHLGRHEQRLDCLLQLERLEPDNAKVISETGLCLIQLRRWQEASQRFFRLELEGRHIAPSQRAIAWCSLQQGKHEQAMKYYVKLMESTDARWQDYLNAGHTAWMQGNTARAIELYKGYIRRYLTDDPKITDALTPFNEDNELLLSLGKKQHEIDLMHDLLES